MLLSLRSSITGDGLFENATAKDGAYERVTVQQHCAVVRHDLASCIGGWHGLLGQGRVWLRAVRMGSTTWIQCKIERLVGSDD